MNFARSADREYAMQELTSFYLSWLQALPGVVINRPEPQGFCGRWRHSSEWAVLALRAGLPAPPYRQTVDDDPASGYRSLAPIGAKVETVIALEGKLFGAEVPEVTAHACLRLAQLAESDLLGITLFQAANGIWKFAAATPYPDFKNAGPELIEHMASVFASKGAAQ